MIAKDRLAAIESAVDILDHLVDSTLGDDVQLLSALVDVIKAARREIAAHRDRTATPERT